MNLLVPITAATSAPQCKPMRGVRRALAGVELFQRRLRVERHRNRRLGVASARLRQPAGGHGGAALVLIFPSPSRSAISSRVENT